MDIFTLSKELCEKGLMLDKTEQLRNLMLSGPPNSERKAIWLQLTGASWQLIENVGYYHKLLETKIGYETIATMQIDKDLERTFATEKYFVNKANVQKLRNVLVAYSFRNEIVGYCQGLNFIVARLLGLGYTEEESFWVLAQILEKYMPFDYYTDMTGLIVDVKVLEKLISIYLPKVDKRLKEINLEPMLFAVQWFVCIYSYNFPSDLVIRVWDIFFIEGILFIFKVALAIMHIFRKEIRALSEFNEGIAYCGTMASKITDIDLLLESTELFPVTIEEIEAIRHSLSVQTPDSTNFTSICSNDAECKRLQKLTSQYFTFMCTTNLNINENYLDENSTLKKLQVKNGRIIEDTLMIGVRNHYCSKENNKIRLSRFFIKQSARKNARIVMPRITLSPFFFNNEISEIVEMPFKFSENIT